MKKGIERKREKLKWLTALCLCLLCFSLCLSLLARPTRADAPGFLEELERIGVMRWDDSNCGVKRDSFGDMQDMSYTVGGAFSEPGTICWARYRLGGNFVAISGRLGCADESTSDAAMRLNIYDGRDALIYSSGPILRGTRPFEFSADLSGLEEMRMELVQMDVDGPALPEGQASQAFALLIYPMLTRAAPPPPVDTSTSPETSAETTTSPETSESSTTAGDPSTTYHLPVLTYLPVEGWYHLYRQYAHYPPSGPFSYVFSFSGNPQEDRTPVYEKGDDRYYFEVLRNNVYLALTRGGLFDVNDAVWAGPDGNFGTVDDRIAVLRAGSFFYEEKPGEWKFLASRFDYVDSRWSRLVEPTTAPTAGSTGSIETTTDGFLTTGNNNGMPPKTGVPFSAGLFVCVAALFMGCVYCGYRLLRKEQA